MPEITVISKQSNYGRMNGYMVSESPALKTEEEYINKAKAYLNNWFNFGNIQLVGLAPAL